LQFQWGPLTVQTLKFEVPFDRHILGKVALAIVTCLITEYSLDDQLTGWADQLLQSSFLAKSDLTVNLDLPAINWNGFTDRFEMQHLRGREFEGVPLGGRPAVVQSPVDRNVALHTGGVDVHAGFQFDVETESDAKSRPRDGITRRRGDLKVIGFCCSPRRIHRRSELPGQNIGGSNAVLVIIFEVLRHDPALGIDDVHTRIRDAVADGARLDAFIKDVESTYDSRLRVREKRISYVLPVAEVLERAR